MYRMLIVCLLMALFVTAGCNKADSKKAPAVRAATKLAPAANNTAGPARETPENSEAGKPGTPDEGLVSTESHDVFVKQASTSLPEEDIKFIRAELIRVAPENGFTYDAEANVITGEGLPVDGLDLEVLVYKVAREGASMPTVVGDTDPKQISHDIYAKWCNGIFLELKPKQESPAKASKPKTQQRVSSGGASNSSEGPKAEPTQSAEAPLVFASSAIGEWKSIREDHPRITTYHNDDYFEFYRFMHDGLADIKFFRGGQMVVLKEFSFKYNPRNGEISLFDASKKIVETLVLQMASNNEDLLFVDFPEKDSTVVFERIGTGYPADVSMAPGLFDNVND